MQCFSYFYFHYACASQEMLQTFRNDQKQTLNVHRTIDIIIKAKIIQNASLKREDGLCNELPPESFFFDFWVSVFP